MPPEGGGDQGDVVGFELLLVFPQGHPVDLLVGDSLVASGLAIHHYPIPLGRAEVGDEKHVGPPGPPKPRGVESEEGEGVASSLLESGEIRGVVCRFAELTNQSMDFGLQLGWFHQRGGGARSFFLDGRRFSFQGLLNLESGLCTECQPCTRRGRGCTRSRRGNRLSALPGYPTRSPGRQGPSG
jgi:hypothetical protein